MQGVADGWNPRNVTTTRHQPEIACALRQISHCLTRPDTCGAIVSVVLVKVARRLGIVSVFFMSLASNLGHLAASHLR
jgi:hypothetical protein